MTDVRFVAVDPTFEVVVSDEAPASSPARQREIERLWDAELSRGSTRPGDSPVLVYLRSDRRRLTARWVPLRELAVGRRDPRLFDWQPPVPVGVCGRLSAAGRLVLGRRAAGQGRWSGRWEMVPSNDLDRTWSLAGDGRIDVGLGLRSALDRTTPLGSVAASRPEPFALAYDELEPAWRVCVAQELALDHELEARLEASSTERYDAFRLARPVDVIEAGMLGATDLVPMTSALVRLPSPTLGAAG